MSGTPGTPSTKALDTKAPEANPRRGFLSVAAAGLGGVFIAPGIQLMTVAHAATPTNALSAGANPQVRWGMLIDAGKCVEGCSDCVSACNTENGLNPTVSPTSAQWIRKIEIKQISTGRTASAPVMCQHCAEPPCVDVCPTGASFKRADGIVLVDRHSCIGCRYCMMACPYKARSFVHEELSEQVADVPRGKGCVESCTLCVHRLDQGDKTTACAQACSHGAILFGDLNDASSDIARKVREIQTTQLRADLKLDPGVRYHGL
ncbi:MAG: 4Fe-4S dicluster domain-containing protein [Vitreoscilla sp.]|nr:4Fe-4S dicluster domain-containing protein [Burkholderiales bacterium]MBP6337029.1 4Fe-4S dicluster domain-containing protein [Vitreoscilla sp.]MBP6674825.1 4Fe-4S dicluster domain-containing protein [Vitreoscilla sp.]